MRHPLDAAGLALAAMNVSVVLRLLPEALAEGRLAGSLHVVDTGEHAVVHSTEELVSFLRERCGRAGEEDLARDQ